jgi:hypothetical protein
MGSQPGQFIIRIIVKDSHKRQDPLSTEETVVWHTLDRLEGHVIIQSAVPLTLDKVDMRIEGNLSQLRQHSLKTHIKITLNRAFQGLDKRC